VKSTQRLVVDLETWEGESQRFPFDLYVVLDLDDEEPMDRSGYIKFWEEHTPGWVKDYYDYGVKRIILVTTVKAELDTFTTVTTTVETVLFEW